MNFSDTIRYGRETIHYTVLFVKRRTMEIAVHPDARVIVKAPIGTKPEEIKVRVQKRARWISRQRTFFKKFDPHTPSRRYLSGETHLYLGRQYRLKVLSGNQREIKLKGGYLIVSYPGKPASKTIKELLGRWYLDRARVKFAESLEHCIINFQRMGYKEPMLKIRKMKTRWGSLSQRGTLTLNSKLISASRESIAYVITHELCHLEHKNHNADFYRLLNRVMPGWENRKQRLEISLI
jgi:predicted metal-dependent hydrolase